MNLERINELLNEIVFAADHKTDPETATQIEHLVDEIKGILEGD